MTDQQPKPTPRRVTRRALRPGRQLAPGYRVLDHLSRAHDLDVYDVWSDERKCRCVAKVLRPDRLDSAGIRRHLVREGRLLLRLSHPHIVRAYELIEDAQPVLILETLTGATLSWIVRELRERGRRLAFQDLVHLGLHVASALGYLHRHRVLHLDVKPSNVVSERTLAKLIDLSVSRPPGKLPRPVGTYPYMSPEQLRHEEATEATDVWGLGLTLYEAASGGLPFQGNGGPVYPQLTQRAAPLRSVRRTPAAFASLLDACLEPDAGRRPTLSELTGTLNGYV